MAKDIDAARLQPGDPGYVGRGHPPEHGKIRKGEKRNPWGRKGKNGQGKRQASLGSDEDLVRLFSQPVRSKDGKLHSRDELFVHSVTKGMTEGSVPHLKLYLTFRIECQQRAQAADETQLDAVGEAILVDYGRELLRSYGIDPDAPPLAVALPAASESEMAEGEDEDHV